ncbi:ECF-type sigma factor [Thalassoglobus sp.]|uniref:ECF-type sigma factor n=1 Tax=Thalassoglobus sp. TaxID=2795869 RepID=UPI003AA8EDB1
MSDITRVLRKFESGDQFASSELLPLVYAELRKLAAQRMKNERFDHTLQPTALVHEAFLRLVDVEQVQTWDSQAHFFSAAAEAMRRILIDHARSKKTKKRDGSVITADMNQIAERSIPLTPEHLLELDEALQKLEADDPQIAELVKLRVYGGLSITEAAKVLGASRATAFRCWKYAKAWFNLEFTNEE